MTMNFRSLVWPLGMLAVALLLRYMPQSYGVMLLRSFAFQVLTVFALATLFWLVRGRLLKSGIGLLSVLVINSFLPPLLADNGIIEKGEGFSVAHFNVLMVNGEHGSTIAQALDTDADLISFQEVDGEWMDSLRDALECKYPYIHAEAQRDFHGIAVFSKVPFRSVETFDTYGDPAIQGIVDHKGMPVNFICLHARSPLPHFNFVKRNRQLEDVKRRLQGMEGPTVLFGDLNAVPWDEQIVELRSDSGLIDGRMSMAPTFPSFVGAVGIPIDHILHSKDMRCLDFRTISGSGSDHRGVLGVYVLNG